MRLPWSVTNGASPGPGRSVMAPWHPVSRGDRFDQPHRRQQPEAHNLDGKRKDAERADQLALVGDHHHAVGRGGDDLLAQQRAAAALDQPKLIVDLVGAIDGEIEMRRLVERGERDVEPLGLGARRIGGGDAEHVQALADALAERGDEACRGRAGAKPKPHPVLDEIERGAGRALFQTRQS